VSARLRLAGALVAATAGLAALGAGHWAAQRAERDWATRAAQSAAAYLALVAPTAPGATSYDLARLLAQARGLASLPGWTGVVEVYHGTAPLVRATAAPLDAAAFATLRERELVQALGDAQLVPLKDRDDWDVVGAVAVRVSDVTLPLLNGWTLTLLVVLGVTGALAADRRRRRRVAVVLGLTAVLAGVTGYRVALTGARRATDGWLMQARVLLSEVGARVPTRSAATAAVRLAPLVRGAQLAVSDSGDTGVQRAVVAAGPRATTRVQLMSGRWLALTVLPGEATLGGWLPVTLGLVALGVLGVLFVAWIARARARPRMLRETLTAWGFLAPATLHLAVFSFGPMLFAAYLALHRWSPLEPVKPFVGLDNFVALARDPLVWISLRNTLLYTLHVPVAMAIALGVALVLQHRSGAARVARTIFFLPYVSSLVAVALVWQWMYHADFGLLNYLGALVGLPPVDWLGNPRTALVAVMVVSIWVQVGYQMIVFLAGLQGIPQDYLDAARVDGASPWQRFWRVTFPLLRPVTLFVLVTGVITSFQVFTLIYVLTDGGPLHATDVLVYRIYQMAWEFLQFGNASALALMLFALLFGATWLQLRLLGKRVDYA
jgi:ABC-type sugar transport system permease subunit